VVGERELMRGRGAEVRPHALRRPSAERRPPSAGFTLVELLAVISIIVMLMGLGIFGIIRYRQRAFIEGSRGAIQKVRSALEEYRSVYAAYPPDGYDFPVQGPGGIPIRGAQCLVHFLGRPTKRLAEYGDERTVQELPPFLEVTADMLTGGGELDERLQDATTEIKDAYGNAVFYDNTERDPRTNNARLSLQGEADPRAASGGRAKSPGAFDLWSSGSNVEDAVDDIGSWQTE
jgi:prepilin-type N-terminal cleavage/methylation domain-containing protein